MSIHINAKTGEIAEVVLLPGDPLRAKHIAETYLEDVSCYNEVRNMFGYTGTYKGKRISVQGTGMGVPSISIYVNELMQEYGVKTLIRVGTCGGLSTDVKVRDVIIAMTSSTDSSLNRRLFNGDDYAPCADFGLLKNAYDIACQKGLEVKVGGIYTSDQFYDKKSQLKQFADYGVLGVEMETTALYTLASRNKCKALTVLTVSDHVITGEETTALERQTTFNDMIEIALETAIKEV